MVFIVGNQDVAVKQHALRPDFWSRVLDQRMEAHSSSFASVLPLSTLKQRHEK
jgi:hypothetical protein